MLIRCFDQLNCIFNVVATLRVFICLEKTAACIYLRKETIDSHVVCTMEADDLNITASDTDTWI